MKTVTPEQIDELLPQTQCGLCGHGGCMPYAEAIVFEQAPLNLCPPGGVKTMQALGKLLEQDISRHIPEMEQQAKPPLLAVIREAECIGCTKCIQACPVDAILGTGKQMHTVIADECTGCELCVAPCPVDCIDIISVPQDVTDTDKRRHYRQRFLARESRLKQEKQVKQAAHQVRHQETRKSYIQDAIARARAKKNR